MLLKVFFTLQRKKIPWRFGNVRRFLLLAPLGETGCFAWQDPVAAGEQLKARSSLGKPFRARRVPLPCPQHIGNGSKLKPFGDISGVEWRLVVWIVVFSDLEISQY